MRKIIILLTLSLTVIYTNAQTEKSIQQITQEVMERASIQYTNMASTLEKDRVPRSFSKTDSSLQISIGGVAVFIQAHCGTFMNIPVLKI